MSVTPDSAPCASAKAPEPVMRRPRGKITVLLLEPSGIAHLALSYLDRLSGGQKTAGGISAVINLAPGMIITGWVVQRV